MNLVSLILFLIAFFLFTFGLRKNSDLFSPARFFAIVWAVSIGLANLKFSSFQHEWSLFSWIALLTGIFSFLLGTFSVYVINLNNPLLTVCAIKKEIKTRPLNYDNLFHIAVIIFFAYSTCYIAEAIIEGYIPIFSKRIEWARIDFGVFGLHLIVNTMVTILVISTVYLVLAPKSFSKKLFTTIIVILTTLTFFFLLQRYNFVLVVLFVIGIFYYSTNKLNLKNILIGSVTFLSFLGYIQSIRLSQYVQNYIHAFSKMRYSVEYAIFSEPYLYITMNLENYARATDKLENFTYGYFTTDWILALTGLKHWLEQYFTIEKLPFLNSGYNTFPFHWTYYNDFGLVGVLTFPFVTGFIISYIYFRMRRTALLKWLIFYSLGIVVIGISFIMNPLPRLDFMINVVLLFLIFHYWIKEQPKIKIHEK
jgi:oligosaccharide repeat unit polymerase